MEDRHMLARRPNRTARLATLGLAAHALTAGLVFNSVLSCAPKAAVDAAPPPPAPEQVAPAEETAKLVPAPELLREERTTRAELAPSERETAELATTTLAQVLQDSAAEDELWADSVAYHARTLDAGDAQALQLILADAKRPVEEHIAASELLDALGAR